MVVYKKTEIIEIIIICRKLKEDQKYKSMLKSSNIYQQSMKYVIKPKRIKKLFFVLGV